MASTTNVTRLKHGEAQNVLRLTEVDEAPHRLPTAQELGMSATAFGAPKWAWSLILVAAFTAGIPVLIGFLWRTDDPTSLFWNSWFVVADTLILVIALLALAGSVMRYRESQALRAGLAQPGQARHEVGEVVESRVNPSMRHLFDGRFLLTVRIAGHDYRIARISHPGHFTASAIPEVGDRVDAWVLSNGPVIVQAPKGVPRQPLGRPVVGMPAVEVQRAAAQVTSPVRACKLDRIRVVAPPESADRLARTPAEWGETKVTRSDWLFVLVGLILVGVPLAIGVPLEAWRGPDPSLDESWSDVWGMNLLWLGFPWFFIGPALVLFAYYVVRSAGHSALHRVYPADPMPVPNITGWIVRLNSNIDSDDGKTMVTGMRVLTEGGQLVDFAKVHGATSLSQLAVPVIGGGVRIWQLSDGRMLAQTALRAA
ncbi:hypothetical protein EG850_10665 [Gulosibacter macacae]|uniref:Uncharacterized protein n=1 Tax=Gulosibacter macacae TaxID=2488791 RepID=A0A3P3VZ78_9MICO|nr:hypothetical protein [Gulosibacter macacae]RRJ85993.1 hypothetical protein EG850_10665 [Gulosibacter macacae]